MFPFKGTLFETCRNFKFQLVNQQFLHFLANVQNQGVGGSPSLPIKQAAVGLDLHLQACLDVQQLLIFRVLALGLAPDLADLPLQAADLHLDL